MSKHNETDILGETKSQKAKIPARVPKLGEAVSFATNGDHDFVKHVALVTKVHPPVGEYVCSVDLVVFNDTFVDFRKRVPYQKETTSGAYQWLT